MSLNDFSSTNALESNALFVLPEARSVLSPISRTEPKRVPTQRLEITRIPQAMRNMGWVTSARMMERWLSTPAWDLTEIKDSEAFDYRTLPYPHYDDTIVTMSWARKFQRTMDAIAEAGRLSFRTKKGLELLKARLRQWNGRDPYRLGYYGMPTRSFDALCQVNFVSLGTKFSTLDDMYGALGIANLMHW